LLVRIRLPQNRGLGRLSVIEEKGKRESPKKKKKKKKKKKHKNTQKKQKKKNNKKKKRKGVLSLTWINLRLKQLEKGDRGQNSRNIRVIWPLHGLCCFSNIVKGIKEGVAEKNCREEGRNEERIYYSVKRPFASFGKGQIVGRERIGTRRRKGLKVTEKTPAAASDHLDKGKKGSMT